jgi:hypothetical protein
MAATAGAGDVLSRGEERGVAGPAGSLRASRCRRGSRTGR